VDASDRFLHAARRYARRAKDRRVLAMIEQNLGINCNIRGALDAALQHYRRALGCYERLGETRYTAQVLNVLGMLYTDLRRWGAAEKSLARSAELCETLGERTTHVMVEVSRAELFATQGALDRARSACDRANALARALGQEPALGEVMRWYGVIDRERGEFEAAETSLRDAHRIAKRHGIRLLEAESQRELALLFRAQSRNREALASLLASRRLFHDLRAERDLAELGRRLDEIERQFLSVVRDWAESIEAKDRYTHGHCNRVAEYGTTLARQFGFDDDTLRWFHMGAFLHDVGKMDVPIAILNKPGRLTDEEFAIMKRHTTAGDAIVADLEFPWDIRPLVRSHHEHWNGRGYPDRLAGEAIPLAARILCVADVFDALTTTRPYRPALTIEEALAVMRDGAGTQFDPAVWTEFEALVTSGLFASVLAA
jgi:putative nucleotidyltransferase with HDIG domain